MSDKENIVFFKGVTTATHVTHTHYAAGKEGVWCRYRRGVRSLGQGVVVVRIGLERLHAAPP